MSVCVRIPAAAEFVECGGKPVFGEVSDVGLVGVFEEFLHLGAAHRELVEPILDLLHRQREQHEDRREQEDGQTLHAPQ